jgi:hypothetical protein
VPCYFIKFSKSWSEAGDQAEETSTFLVVRRGADTFLCLKILSILFLQFAGVLLRISASATQLPLNYS